MERVGERKRGRRGRGEGGGEEEGKGRGREKGGEGVGGGEGGKRSLGLQLALLFKVFRSHLQCIKCCITQRPKEGSCQHTAEDGIERTHQSSGSYGVRRKMSESSHVRARQELHCTCASKDVNVDLLKEVDGEGVRLRQPAQNEEDREEKDKDCVCVCVCVRVCACMWMCCVCVDVCASSAS